MSRRLTIVAGAGRLVPELVEAALAAGDRVQVLALTPREPISGVRMAEADIRNPLGLLWAVRMFRSSHVVLGGAVSLSDKVREDIAKLAGGQGAAAGDTALSGFGATVKRITGADLLSVQELCPQLVAPAGHIAGPVADASAIDAGARALRLVREAGRLDLGQAAVMSGRRLIALEDIGGTDELLARVEAHRRAGRIGDGAGLLVLAKASKPGQSLDIDLPAIGADTITGAAEAGISLVVVEANRTLLIDRQELVARAATAGITVLGLVADG